MAKKNKKLKSAAVLENETSGTFNRIVLINLVLFLVVMFAVYAASAASRNMQIKNGWDRYPDRYYVNDIPMTNTLDAYKWVRLADEYRQGIYDTSEKDPLMFYPDGLERPAPVPLLSFLLAKLSGLFEGNLYETGLHLIPFLAGLFIFPFAVYFYRLGYPVAGILGAFCGVFASMYYGRTAAGRIDTDCMNLFFPFLTAVFILYMSYRKDNRGIYIFAALAGLSQLLFYWWYHHAAFILIFLGALVLTMFLNRYKITTIVIASVVYIIFANPLYFLYSLENLYSLLSAYIFNPVSNKGGFPNIYQTITESSKSTAGEIVGRAFIHPLIFYMALAAFVLMAYRNYRKIIPLLPVFCMGLLIFTGSGRFVMYLIPFLGAGLGYLINFAMNKLPLPDTKKWLKNLAGYAAAGLFILAVYLMPSTPGLVFYYLPGPSIPPSLFSTFGVLRDSVPEGSAVYTWWDFGLAIEEHADMATFHDGMPQNTLKTWIIARSFINSQPRMLRDIAYISNEGADSLIQATNRGTLSAREVVETIDTYNQPLINDRVYIMYTNDMIGKYGAIQYIGGWDVINSAAPRRTSIELLTCQPERNPLVNCGNIRLDLNQGMVVSTNTPARMISTVDLRTGTVTQERLTGHPGNVHLIAVQDSGMTYGAMLMNSETYSTAFVQQFLLGLYDSTLLEEVVNIYPMVRVFHVKPGQNYEQ